MILSIAHTLLFVLFFFKKKKKLQETYNQNSFLTEAKQKLASIKNKAGTMNAVSPKSVNGNGVVVSQII
jgi:hypothetical protein